MGTFGFNSFVTTHLVQSSNSLLPRANSQVTISQVGTSQMCNFPSGNFPKVRFDLLRRQGLRLGWARGPNTATSTGSGPSAGARTDLGSVPLGNCTFGKLPLGKIPSGSCLWESTKHCYECIKGVSLT